MPLQSTAAGTSLNGPSPPANTVPKHLPRADFNRKRPVRSADHWPRPRFVANLFFNHCVVSTQACENERRGDRTRFDDERRRFETERKNFEDERGAFVNEIARLQAENEEVRASVGPVAHLSERSKHTLGFLPGISTVLEECSICEELLLSGIGTTSFGVMSYSCACSRAGHTRTLHVNCIVSVADLNCSYCREEIVVIAPSLMAQTLVRKIIVRKT